MPKSVIAAKDKTSITVRVKHKIGPRQSFTGAKQMSTVDLQEVVDSMASRPRDKDTASMELARRVARAAS